MNRLSFHFLLSITLVFLMASLSPAQARSTLTVTDRVVFEKDGESLTIQRIKGVWSARKQRPGRLLSVTESEAKKNFGALFEDLRREARKDERLIQRAPRSCYGGWAELRFEGHWNRRYRLCPDSALHAALLSKYETIASYADGERRPFWYEKNSRSSRKTPQ